MADRVGQQFGDYRLTKNLGAGGFADVYLGEHIYLGTQAAVKVLKGAFAPKEIEQFRVEAQTIARLEQPHIVRVITFSVARINSQDIPFLVMEYASNGTLRLHHTKGTRLPLETVVSYVKQIADGLQYAHDQKIIHRDVKPENMLVGRRNEVLLSDFGIALTTPQTGTLTTQEMAGTVAYMAPEQIKGKPRPASDQYSLGVAVYEWISGERPFQGPPWEVVNQHIYTAPPSLREKVPTLPLAVEEVVFRALAKEPQQRFPTIQEFASALEQASQGTATSSTAFPVNQPATAQPSPIPPIEWARPLPPAQIANQVAAQPSPMPPTERVMQFPPAQVANQAAARVDPTTPTEWVMPLPPNQMASPAPANQSAAQSAPSPSSQRNSRFSIPREPIQDIPLPANAEPHAQTPSPVRPGAVPGPGSSKTTTTEHQRGRALSRTALLVGLAILLVVVAGGLLLIPALTRGTTTVTTQPGTTINPATLVTSNGTMFGFDLQRTHFNANEHTLTPANVSGLVPDWTTPAGGFVDSSPTVANGVVYVGSDDNKLYAFTTTGKLLWTGSTGNKIRSSPAVANGMVYVGSYDHNLYAFKASGCGNPSCRPIWTAPTDDVIRSSPAVANGIVYIGSNDHKLYAFNAATGKPVWTAPTEGIIDFSSPAISDGTVYIGSEDHNLYAFNAATGKFLWTASTGGIINFSSPAVANGVVYIGSGDGKLYAFKASGCGSSSCPPIWTAQAANSINSSPAVANGMVYVGSDDHHVYAFDAAKGTPVWTSSAAGNVVRSSPTVANGVVYVGSDDGMLYAFNASGCGGNASCNPLWTASTGNQNHIFSSPAVADGVVYVGSTDKQLHAFHLPGTTP